MSDHGDGPRIPRALRVEPDVAALLGALAARDERPLTASLNLDALYAVEVALAYSFRDDLLVAFAADLPSLHASHRFGLSEVIGHCGRLREAGRRGDLIGLGVSGGSEYVLEKRRANGAHTMVSRLHDGRGSSVVERFPLADFLARVGGISKSSATSTSLLTATLHRPPPMADAPGRVVVHSVFGRGTAFSEQGSGPMRKVKCDFPGIGLKVIAARFLEFVDEGSEVDE